MNGSKRTLSVLAAIGVAAALVAAGPVTAHATPGIDIDTDGFLEIQPGATSAEANDQIVEALHELEGKQSREEIEALSDLPGTTFLVAADNGEYAAAVNTASSISTFALTVPPFGCTSTSMCIRNSAYTPIVAYEGSGVMNGTISGVKDVQAGDRIGSVTTTANNIYVLQA